MPDLTPVLNALAMNLSRMSTPEGDSFRVFHGRGKNYPGLEWLTLDFHNQVLLLTVFGRAEPERDIFLEKLQSEIVKFVEEHHGAIVADRLLVQRRDKEGAPFSVESYVEKLAELPDSNYALRKELKFGLNFSQQNTGFFLDIEPAREWLASQCEGKKILNLFSYTCAFSVVAMANGASSVVNIDMSKRSLSRGKENHATNDLSTENVRFLGHDIFKSWGKLKKLGPYDIVICDPPSFQKGSFVAQKDYGKVVRRVETLLSDSGVALFCLNAPEIEQEGFREEISNVSESLEYDGFLPLNCDFPERDEGCGLKMLLFKKV